MNNKRFLLAVLLIGLFSGAVFLLRNLPGESTSAPGPIDKNRRVPVEVVAIEHGPIALHRTFSGTLEARAEFVVAPKVAGRVERLTVNIADPVTRGQVVGELDSEEYVQAVAQARADLAVSKANLAEAKNALEITRRELDRIETLRQRGVASESQLDAVKANELAKQAELEVAEAQAVRAEASVKTAEIRLGYTRITAGWSGGEEQRVVAERFVDEGETVSANTPLLRIVELDPMTGVVFVTERDYARLQPGQSVTLTTDAFPGEEFLGHIERIAPVFKQSTRQARVELSIDNPGQRLKPGMFVRATVVLARAENATIIPEQALTKRNDRTGLFLVSPDGQTVTWHEVSVAIRDGDRVQIDQDDLSGRVVILGQQLLENGSAISIASQPSTQDKTDSSPEQK
ncbi:MAG: efflux RND transporter periplasmic adaptor subunit [Desulfuromonadales bacterium]|jgi:RND family efflux transporter MFP subunit